MMKAIMIMKKRYNGWYEWKTFDQKRKNWKINSRKIRKSKKKMDKEIGNKNINKDEDDESEEDSLND